MISHARRFIFVHIGRTGGSSFERLAGVASTSDLRTAHAGNTDFPNKHAIFNYYYKCYPTEFSQYFKFTIIRNPYDRLVSAWFWRCAVVKDHSLSLYDFALSRPVNWAYRGRLKLENLSFENSLAMLDYVARYETLGEDMKLICSKTGLDYSAFPHTNRTGHSKYWDYYDDKTIELVTSLFQFDIGFFGYKFGE
jgi:hypothetical protein